MDGGGGEAEMTCEEAEVLLHALIDASSMPGTPARSKSTLRAARIVPQPSTIFAR